MLIFTSLSPSTTRQSAQQAALTSWRTAGHVPVAVQHPDDDIEHLTSDQIVVMRDTDVTRMNNKVYMRLDAIIKQARTVSKGRIAIINADCEITCPSGHIESVADPMALSIFSRTDVDADGANEQVFPWGFDAFVFDPDLLGPHVPSSPLALGLPWWDYLLPMVAINNKIPVMRHDNVLRHIRHEDRYEYPSYLLQATAIERALGLTHNSRHTILSIINANTTLVQ